MKYEAFSVDGRKVILGQFFIRNLTTASLT